jgi:5S rRNA maturation endonuclease (ribonuclease M5)
VDWVAYLSTKGYTGRRATGAEVTYPCFFDCNEPADSRKKKLYVNADTGLYSCKVCVSEGNHVKLMRHFGDEPENPTDARSTRCLVVNDLSQTRDALRPTTGRRSEVLADAVAAGEKFLAQNDTVLEYLLGERRNLSPETIVERRLGFAPRGWDLTRQLPTEKKYREADHIAAGLIHPEFKSQTFVDRVLIPYIEEGRIVQLRGKDIDGRYYTPVGDAVYLYNVDSLKGATEAVLVEGEFDCMMLADLLATSGDERIRNMAVIGLAGTGAIPEDFAQRLAHLRRVFIATDPDEPGRKAADKLLERLGSRGHIMAWPESLLQSWTGEGRALKDLDWTTWIGQIGASVEEVGELLKVQGRLKSAMQALVGHRTRPTAGLKLGFTGLDAAFLPGVLPGQVVVFLAKTGVGKTVLLCNLAYNLRARRVLFITLEMTAEEIWVRIARIYRFYHPFASDETIAREYANLRICDANRLSEDDFERLVEEYTEDVGAKPDIAFVDYLGYYARGRVGGSQYEKATDAIMQLKAEGKKHQLAVITPAQVNRGALDGKPIEGDDARDSGAIEETADLLVGVWRSDDALDLNAGGAPSGKLHMKILKSRHGNRDRVFLMQMGLMSLVVIDDTSTLAEKAKRESHAVFSGKTYEQWLTDIRNHQPKLGR